MERARLSPRLEAGAGTATLDSKSITWLECERAKEVIAFVVLRLICGGLRRVMIRY
jgi:hypothetical protein